MLGIVTPLDVLTWCGVAVVAIIALFIVVAVGMLIVDTVRGTGPVPKSRRKPDADPTRKRVI